MNKLIGTAPRHPGLWVDMPNNDVNSTQAITTLQTHSQGLQELTQHASKLASLSHQGRWIVLINPGNINYKQLLANAGVRMDRVLLVHTKDEFETLWAMEKALTSGTSSAVICWTSTLDQRDSRRLQLVAKSARALGIVIENHDEIAPNFDVQQSLNSNQHTANTINFSAFH